MTLDIWVILKWTVDKWVIENWTTDNKHITLFWMTFLRKAKHFSCIKVLARSIPLCLECVKKITPSGELFQ